MIDFGKTCHLLMIDEEYAYIPEPGMKEILVSTYVMRREQLIRGEA